MNRENEFTVPDQAKWNRMVLHDDLLCGEKYLPEGIGSKILKDIAVDMQRHLNIPSLLKYMMSRNLLTNSETWKLQDSSVPPDERFLQLWQVLQGKGADHGLLVFYLCLMESYGPEPGLTGHYILIQIIRQRVRLHCNLPASDRDQQDTKWIVSRIKPLPLTHDQAQRLTRRLQLPGISSNKPPTLDVICNNWLATHKGGDWKVVAAVLLTERGLGCSVSGVLPPSSSNHPEIWNYVRELGENWENFAEYLGFPRSLICHIQNEWSLDIPTQLQKFMQVCLIPNCKERMSTIVNCIKQYVPTPVCLPKDRDSSGEHEVRVPIGVFAQLLKQNSQDQSMSAVNEDGASGSSVNTEITGESDVTTSSESAPRRSSQSTAESPQPSLAKDETAKQYSWTLSDSIESSDQELGMELLQACINEHWQLAMSYITANCNLEATTKNGRRALHICCMKGKRDMVELLVQHGADVSAKDDDDNCCLHYRETLKYETLVRLLIETFAKRNLSTDQANMNGFTPLTITCQTGDICYDSALLLITNGARLNGMHKARCTPLIYASGGGSVRLVELLLTFCANKDAQDRDGNTALIQACLCNHLDIARMLLENGASVHKADKKGSTALAAAVSKNSYELVQILIRYGANVNVTRYITSEFTMGQVEETPLASACARGYQPIAELLIENGAKINHMCSDQVPPIGFAIICRQSHIVKYLLQLPGFSKSAYGLAAPLHTAISVGNYDAAKLLLDAIGGPNRALEMAKRENHTSFAQEIQIFMAMASEDMFSTTPEHFTGAGSILMEGEHRVKVEEILQKFCQISMSAISKKDLDSLVEIASALDEPNVACFFQEYREGKLLMPDVLKSRFLSSDSGTPPATFAIQHGLLDSIQFHIHALEAYPKGPQQFYEDLVLAFHQISGGEDLPWDIDSVLERLFRGQFSLGVKTASVADASMQGPLRGLSKGSSQQSFSQTAATNEGRRLGRADNTYPSLGSKGINTFNLYGKTPSKYTLPQPALGPSSTLGATPQRVIQSPPQPALGPSSTLGATAQQVIQSPPQPALGASSTLGTTPQRVIQSPPQPPYGPNSTLGATPQQVIQSPPQPALWASSTLGTTPQRVIQSPPQPPYGPNSTLGATPQQVIQSPPQPALGPSSTLGATPQQVIQSPPQLPYGPSSTLGATPQQAIQSPPQLPYGPSSTVGATPQRVIQTPPQPALEAISTLGTTPQQTSSQPALGVTPTPTPSLPTLRTPPQPALGATPTPETPHHFSQPSLQMRQEPVVGIPSPPTTTYTPGSNIETISECIAEKIGPKWTQLYSYLCSEPQGRYHIDSNHRDEPTRSKTKNCTLDTIKLWRSSQHVCKLEEKEVLRQLLLALKKVRGCDQLVGYLCATHGISLEPPTPDPERLLEKHGQLTSLVSRDSAFQEEEGYSSDSSSNKEDDPPEAIPVSDHGIRADLETIPSPTAQQQDGKESAEVQSESGQRRSYDTTGSTGNGLGELPITKLSDTSPYEEGVHWQKLQLLGRGAFCECHLAKDIKRNTIFAVKQVSYTRNTESEQEDTLKMLNHEVEIQRRLKHPNIVKCLGAVQHKGFFNIFVEWIPAGSLDQLLDKGGPFTELTVCNYTGQIIHGVAYLHENGIIHRDLKGANILVNQTGGRVLIADFGTAATLKTSTTVTGEFKDTKGTAPFMAPEVIRGTHGGYGRKCDIWSVGCVIIQMATAKLPWEEICDITNSFTLIFTIGSATGPPPMPKFTECPQLNELTEQCLQINPDGRPTANELLQKHSRLFAIK